MNAQHDAKRSDRRAHLPSYVQVETRPEARLLPPLVGDLARHLAASFPASPFDVSIGLWGKTGVVGPADFDAALDAALASGATQIWVTPNDHVTDEHRASVLRRLVR